MDVYEVREYNLWDTSIVLTNDSNAVTKLPKIARLISKTTNITAKVSAEINKKKWENWEQLFFKTELLLITCYLNIILVVSSLLECAVLISLISLLLMTTNLNLSKKVRLVNMAKMILPFTGPLILFQLIIIIRPCACQCVTNLINHQINNSRIIAAWQHY